MNLTTKKIIAAVSSLAIAAGAVAGTVALTDNNSVAKNQNAVVESQQTGSVKVENAIAEGEGEGTDDVTKYDHPLQGTYPNLNVVDETETYLRNKLLYGNGDKTEDDYFLGKAAFFSIFAKNVTLTDTLKDVEGRVAADEFDTSLAEAYGVGGALNVDKETKLSGSADVICNNDNLGWFGFTSAKYKSAHSFVFSSAVQEIKGSTTTTDNGSNLYVADNLIDFDAEFAKLEALSAKLATADANLGRVQVTNSDVTVTGKDEEINVFTFTKEQWDGFAGKNLKFDVPTGSFIIVNISGSDVRFNVNMFINGVSIGQGSTDNCYVMLNFYEAENVEIVTESPRGTILAPKARVTTNRNQHVDGQVIAETVLLNYEQGFTTFSMPADYANEITYTDVEETKYAAHYVFWGIDGKYHEINVDGVFTSADRLSIGNAFDNGDIITVLGTEDINATTYDWHGETYTDKSVVWDVYIDNDNVMDAVYGADLLAPDSYEKLGLTKLDAPIKQGDTYTFDNSNVYFVANFTSIYEPKKVVLHVESDYKDNFENLDFDVLSDGAKSSGTYSLKEDGESVTIYLPVYTDNNWTESVNSINTSNITEGFKLSKDIEILDYENTIHIYVADNYVDAYVNVVYEDGERWLNTRPSLDVDMDVTQADGNNPGSTNVPTSFTSDGKTTNQVKIAEDILPGEYSTELLTYSKELADKYYVDGVTVKELDNGDILYTVTVRQDRYDVRYYDTNGVEITNLYGNYAGLNQVEGYDERILADNWQGKTNVDSNRYKYVWFDKENGKTYNLGDSFTYPAADTNLYLTVVRAETAKPWIFCDIISYMQKHYISGSKVAARMEYDDTVDVFTIYGGKTFEELKADKENKYFMFSMVLGVDNHNVGKTRFTITKGGYDGALVYDAEVSHTDDNPNLIQGFQPFGKNSDPITGKDLIGEDPFLTNSEGKNDAYDGYRQVRLILPAEEFEKETLYITAYYEDDNGQEYMHAKYSINLADNDFWKLKG